MLQVFYQYSDLSGTLCLKVIQSLKLMQILPESKWHFPLPANLSQANDLLKIITKKLFYFTWSEFLYIFYKLLYYPAELLMGSGKQFASFPCIFVDQCTHQLWKRRDFFSAKICHSGTSWLVTFFRSTLHVQTSQNKVIHWATQLSETTGSRVFSPHHCKWTLQRSRVNTWILTS